MLVQTQKFDKGDIVAMKLVNGDEVVAEIIADEMMSYTVSRPCTVIPSPKGIALMQSLMTSDAKTLTISKQHVMMISKVIDEMTNHYIQTTTGIQPVTRGGIIG
jgi:hypothetical protein